MLSGQNHVLAALTPVNTHLIWGCKGLRNCRDVLEKSQVFAPFDVRTPNRTGTSTHLCAERSRKESDNIRNQMMYTWCNRRNGPDFGRVFRTSNYTDITQNTYIQSWTVTEILAREKSGLLWCLRTVLVSVTSFSPPLELHSYVRANVAPAT